MENRIVIDDGLKTYEIANKDGKVLGSFSFNPSDTNIVHRHAEVVADLEKLELRQGEKAEEKPLEESMKEMEAIVYEKIDYLLNAEVSKDFFAIMGPFSPLASGKYFIESVIDAIGQAISVETGDRVKKMKAMQSKIKKHTGKYHG